MGKKVMEREQQGGDPTEVSLLRCRAARDAMAPEEVPPELLALLDSMEGFKVRRSRRCRCRRPCISRALLVRPFKALPQRSLTAHLCSPFRGLRRRRQRRWRRRRGRWARRPTCACPAP